MCDKCGGVGYVRLNVPMSHRLFGKPVPCSCKQEEMRQRRMAALREMSGLLGTEMSQWTFETFKPELAIDLKGQRTPRVRQSIAQVKHLCEEYAANPKGCFILMGLYGCGKTHLACAIGNRCLESGHSVYYNTAPEILQMLKQGFGDKADVTYDARFEMLKTVDVLIIDDLGTENATPWALEQFYIIFNHRYRQQLPLVITTNINLEHPSPKVDERIRSRIRQGIKQADGWAMQVGVPAGDLRPYIGG